MISNTPWLAPANAWWVEEARRLHDAERHVREVTLLSRRRRGVTLADAYRVQAHGAALRVEQGARIVGHKVGLTSEAMQLQVGIDEPDSGVLLDTMAVANGGTVAMEGLRAPRVEAEIAFLIGDEVCGVATPDADTGQVVAGVCLALEVIDSRFVLEGITLADSVADNAGCARFVLGDVRPVEGLDLLSEEVTLAIANRAVEGGRGEAILGDPIRSLAWLARRLADLGSQLRAGDVVLAGAVHASIPLPRGQTVTASSAHLGSVMLDVA
ncbi:MAG TPA: fumarylacetoacetate hydrolase family protein [Streptosporangiaceae bacterium]